MDREKERKWKRHVGRTGCPSSQLYLSWPGREPRLLSSRSGRSLNCCRVQHEVIFFESSSCMIVVYFVNTKNLLHASGVCRVCEKACLHKHNTLTRLLLRLHVYRGATAALRPAHRRVERSAGRKRAWHERVRDQIAKAMTSERSRSIRML